jgi:hypothetical protein
MNRLMEMGPPLVDEDLKQITALPLASRVKVDVWNDSPQLLPPPVREIRSPSEKMPFELSPLILDVKPAEGAPRQDNLDWLTGERIYAKALPAFRR